MARVGSRARTVVMGRALTTSRARTVVTGRRPRSLRRPLPWPRAEPAPPPEPAPRPVLLVVLEARRARRRALAPQRRRPRQLGRQAGWDRLGRSRPPRVKALPLWAQEPHPVAPVELAVGCRQLRRRAPVAPVELVAARLVLWPVLRLRAEARLVRARLWVVKPSTPVVAGLLPQRHRHLLLHLVVIRSVGPVRLVLWPVLRRLEAATTLLLPRRRPRPTRRARCTATTAPTEGTAQGSRTTVRPPRLMTPTRRCSPSRVGPVSLSEQMRSCLRTTRATGRRCEP